MGRSGSFSRSSSRSSTRSSSSISKSNYSSQPVSQPTPQIQHVNHNHTVEKPGFFSNMWQGFGLGAGQSIAHNIFRSNPETTVKHVHTHIPIPAEYDRCLEDNYNNKQKCTEYLNKHQQCMTESSNKDSCKDHFKGLY